MIKRMLIGFLLVGTMVLSGCDNPFVEEEEKEKEPDYLGTNMPDWVIGDWENMTSDDFYYFQDVTEGEAEQRLRLQINRYSNHDGGIFEINSWEQTTETRWETSYSSVSFYDNSLSGGEEGGLSVDELHNEDTYEIRQVEGSYRLLIERVDNYTEENRIQITTYYNEYYREDLSGVLYHTEE